MTKNNKYLKLIWTILVTGLAFAVNYGINLVLTPYIIKNVGTEAYGFVSLAKQFAQYAMIITTALNSFASRYIAIDYHRDNKKEANVFFSSVFWGDLALASAIMAVAVVCILFLENLLNISGNIVTDVKFLFLFVFINFWITTVFSVFTSAAYIKNKLDIVGAFKGLSYITEALVLVVIYVVFPAKVLYVGIGLIAASIVIAISNVWISKKYTPDLIVKKADFAFYAIKRLVLDGIWTSFNSLGNLLNNGLDLIICNLMLSGLAMGQLAVAKTIDTIFHGLFSLVAQAFQPMLLKSYAEEARERLLTELKLAMKLSGLFSNLAFAGFIALGMAYYKLWIPGQDIELIYYLTIITVLTSVSGGPMTPLYYIYTLTVKRVFPCMVTIIGGLFNVVGMYLLIKYTGLGVYAVVWTTAVVMSVINFITNPIYMAKCLKFPWYTFYPNIIRNVISCVVIVVCFNLMTKIYYPSTWIQFIIAVLIYIVVGAAIHMGIVMESGDRKLIIKFVKNKSSR